ncbi:hypothetical protein GCM10009716_10580 [Streptomyces sodiiphilus]|uniref:Methyltransferase domain-containing protein n=1 Tax=Streptomyces sodiiphilus TaxID=226217 RepID=A0ABN2NVR1_9ACTN
MDTRLSTAAPALPETPAPHAPAGRPTAPVRLPHDACGARWLPGLESVAAHGPGAGWLHDTLLGPHSADIVKYLTLTGSRQVKVLDLGAGSGRLSVPFAHHGHRVQAVDRDSPSLARLESWAVRLGPDVRARLTPVRAELAGLRLRSTYHLAVLAGAMVSAVPPHRRRGLFREIARHLEDDGALALDYTAHAPAGLAKEPSRTWAFQVPRFDGVSELVLARQTFDLRTMSERISYHSRLQDGEGTRHSVLTTHKWIVDPGGLDADLRTAGLRVAEREEHRIDHRTRSTLLVCRA